MLSCHLQLDLFNVTNCLRSSLCTVSQAHKAEGENGRGIAGFFTNWRYRISASLGFIEKVRQQTGVIQQNLLRNRKISQPFFSKKQSKEAPEILKKASFSHQGSDSNWNLLFPWWNLLLPKAEQTKKPKAAHRKAETSTALNSEKEF